jgi:C4-dicarboxylate transporter DctM subunit
VAVTVSLIFGSLFVMMMLGVPIGISLGMATAITMYLTTDINMTLIPSACFGGLDSFPLMAIPFFVLAGNLMRYGGISRRLLDIAACIVGHIKGSVGMVTVVASMFFAAISGSAPATVSSIGSITIPEMRKEGYEEGYATALAAASGTIGVIIPPSIPFVIYGVVANASIADLFLAGIIPGIMVGLVLMLVNYVIARRHGYGNVLQFNLRKALLTLKDSIWALLVPVIILGGIYGGFFTPTESAVVGILYSLFIGFFIYKELSLKLLYEALRDTVIINGQSTFLVGLSLSFARYLTMAQVPNKVADSILSLNNPIVIMLMINLMLLLVGCFIDNISSTVILTPILLPIVVGLGISPIQFGIIMTVNLAIGFITPPYGANLFFASAIANVSIEKIAKRILPIIGVMVVVLMLLTYMPIWSMGLLGDTSFWAFK